VTRGTFFPEGATEVVVRDLAGAGLVCAETGTVISRKIPKKNRLENRFIGLFALLVLWFKWAASYLVAPEKSTESTSVLFAFSQGCFSTTALDLRLFLNPRR
jgi:hypothetical protein